mmetsp:Transcript_33203/g.82648  ORF Transcript_33203/g.82648 Transcript_33203/m.82648 type:complete len:220 (-) Transcript_33203:132-791(-)
MPGRNRSEYVNCTSWCSAPVQLPPHAPPRCNGAQLEPGRCVVPRLCQVQRRAEPRRLRVAGGNCSRPRARRARSRRTRRNSLSACSGSIPSSTCRQMCRWASRASWRWFPYCGSTRSRRSFGYSGCKTASDSPSVASPPPGMARRARTASCTASARWGRSPRRGSAASPQSRLRARSPCIGWICNSCHTESSTCSPSSPAPTPRAPAPAACSDLTARPL